MPKKPKKDEDDLSKQERKAVKRLIHVEQELKFHNTGGGTVAAPGNAADTTLNSICLTAVVQSGTTDSVRVGDKIKLRSIQYDGILYGDPSGLAVTPTCRVKLMIIQTYELFLSATGSLVSGDIFDTLAVFNTLNPYRVDYEPLFKVLYEKIFIVSSNTANPMFSHKFHINVPLKYARKQIQYSAATTTANNHIWACWISDIPAGGAEPLFASEGRIRFTDS